MVRIFGFGCDCYTTGVYNLLSLFTPLFLYSCAFSGLFGSTRFLHGVLYFTFARVMGSSTRFRTAFGKDILNLAWFGLT